MTAERYNFNINAASIINNNMKITHAHDKEGKRCGNDEEAVIVTYAQYS